MNLIAVASIPVQTGLLAWLDARGCRALRSIKAHLSHIDARLALIGAFVPFVTKRNGGFHVGVNHSRLIEMRE
jgi:hypothetical protein